MAVRCSMIYLTLLSFTGISQFSYAVTIDDNDMYSAHLATDPPIVNIPGLGQLATDSVVDIEVNQPIRGKVAGTGVLLKGLRYVLTAAHVFDEDFFSPPDDTDVDGEAGGFKITVVTAGGDLRAGSIAGVTAHPDFHEELDLVPSTLPGRFSSSSRAGYDFAIVDLGADFAAQLQPLNITTYDLINVNPVGQRFVTVGFGLVGKGTEPDPVNQPNGQGTDRYWAVNQFDAINIPLPFGDASGTANEQTQLLFDFDDGTASRDGLAGLGIAPNAMALDGEGLARIIHR